MNNSACSFILVVNIQLRIKWYVYMMSLQHYMTGSISELKRVIN
jgi:hypothetical protein